MPNLFAILALLAVAAAPPVGSTSEVSTPEGSSSIRIGLFSLLKPEILEVRIREGAGAQVAAAGLKSDSRLKLDEKLRIRQSGARLNIEILDAFGRVERSVTARETQIVPDPPALLELELPGRVKRLVRGRVAVSASRGLMRIVLATDRESAVASMVAAELGTAREAEALKTLAVVVRTFLISQRGRHASEGYDFCDTTHCQFYRGESDLSAGGAGQAVSNAVAQTTGEILIYGGRALEGYYSAVCGGLSNTPEMVWGGRSPSGYPYRRISCRWCRGAEHYEWERVAAAARVLNALFPAIKARLSASAEIVIESEKPLDFVRSVIIRDRGHEFRLSADEFRRAVGRRLGWSTVLSPSFEIKRRGDLFVFHGRGFGSQAGLCQAGAIRQAAEGRGYREILKYYYPEAEIGKQSANE